MQHLCYMFYTLSLSIQYGIALIRDFKQGLRKRLVRRALTAEEWDEYVESRQNSKPLFTLSKP